MNEIVKCFLVQLQTLDSDDRIHLQVGDFFEMAPLSTTLGHAYKLYKKRSSATVRCMFFSERVVNTWNSLQNSVDFTNLTRFVRTVKRVDLSGYLRCLAITLYLGLYYRCCCCYPSICSGPVVGILRLLWLFHSFIHSVRLRISLFLYRSTWNFAGRFDHISDRFSPLLGLIAPGTAESWAWTWEGIDFQGPKTANKSRIAQKLCFVRFMWIRA